MIRRTHIVWLALIMIFALSSLSFASEEASFCVYNPDATTTNLDATYIQGEIADAKGQTIVIKNTDGVVAKTQVPDISGKYVFRIKIPKDSISEDEVNTYAVTAMTPDAERIRTTYARISYKARKAQKITVKDKKLKLQFPGDKVALNAASSAGLDLSYTSSDESIVKVDKNGNLEPVSGGTAKITINQSNDNEYEDATRTVKVSVKEVPYYTVRYHLGKNAADLVKDEENVVYSNTEDENAGDIVVEQRIAVGNTTTLLPTSDQKGDYEFLGWASSETGYPSYGNAEEVTDMTGDGGTVDLYAVWHGERAQEAIEWASMIAADNSWTYGQGTFRCHVCGTAPKKQYTCMPFLAAAYAHGPRDPIMLSGGRHVINLHDGNFKGELGQIWEKVGLCKDLTIDDLRPGDVIIKWSATNDSGHAWMYGGGDTVIEAVPSDIHVTDGADAKLRRYGSSEGTPSKNYVMRYRY